MREKIIRVGVRMIVLLTDFGESEYVGVMKGIIRTICTEVPIVDLTHSISPHSIVEGAWVLKSSYKYFPHRTIFVVVVDPGVGTERPAVLVKTKNYHFVGPDNGVLYPAATEDGIEQIFRIKVDEGGSHTFHGRDVFAPAAAYLYAGGVGRLLESYAETLTTPLEFHLEGREGQVVRVDRFGNIVTNLPPMDKTQYVIRYKGTEREMRWHRTYSDASFGELFLVTGSAGTLEVSLREGSAASVLGLTAGDIITIA